MELWVLRCMHLALSKLMNMFSSCWRWCSRFSLKICETSLRSFVISIPAYRSSWCIISSENTPSWFDTQSVLRIAFNSGNIARKCIIWKTPELMRRKLKQTRTQHSHPHEEGQISSKKETRLPILPICESPPQKPQLVVTWSLFWKALGRDTVVRLGMSILHRTYPEAPSRMT